MNADVSYLQIDQAQSRVKKLSPHGFHMSVGPTQDVLDDHNLVRTIQLFCSRINISQRDANCSNITCLVKGSDRAALFCHVSSKGITLVIPLLNTWRDRLSA